MSGSSTQNLPYAFPSGTGATTQFTYGSYTMNGSYDCGYAQYFSLGSGCTGGTADNEPALSPGWAGLMTNVADVSNTVWVADGIAADGVTYNGPSRSYVIRNSVGNNYNPSYEPAGSTVCSQVWGFDILGAASCSNGYSGSVAARHLGTANVLYVDGHVKAQHMSTLMIETANTGYCGGTKDCMSAFTVQQD